jgi:hypothetical protein
MNEELILLLAKEARKLIEEHWDHLKRTPDVPDFFVHFTKIVAERGRSTRTLADFTGMDSVEKKKPDEI